MTLKKENNKLYAKCVQYIHPDGDMSKTNSYDIAFHSFTNCCQLFIFLYIIILKLPFLSNSYFIIKDLQLSLASLRHWD